MILLDSNIVIYAAEPDYDKLRDWLRGKTFVISELTKLEVLGYHRLSEDEFEWFTGFFDNIKAIPISTEIINKAIPLRRSYKMSLGDSVIAATAINYDMELCTNNKKDFQSVDKIKFTDTTDLIL